MSKEFYGITGNDFKNGIVPNGIWLTSEERRASNLDNALVIVGQSQEGYYALNTSMMKEGECPVVDWLPGAPTADLEVVSTDFGTFFLDQIKEVM